MNYISSDPVCTQIRLDSGLDLPPVNDENVKESYLSLTPPENREAVFTSLDYLVTPPVVTQATELEDIVTSHLNEAVAGTVTPEEALQNMQAECEERIDLSE